MATDVNAPPNNSTTSVVSDIVSDLQQLLSQQLTMFQAEIRSDVGKLQQAAIPVACGLATLLVGAMVLSVALAYFLNWRWPDLPLWGAFAIVGALVTAIGAVLYSVGKKQLDTVNPLPEKSAQALKENLQWLTPK